MTKQRAVMVKNLSYDEVMALERELVWYSDGVLTARVQQAASTSNIWDKMALWQLLNEESERHLEAHGSIVDSLAVLHECKSDPEFSPTMKDITMTIEEDTFALITDALNSDFLHLERASLAQSFWAAKRSKGEYRKEVGLHKAILRSFRDAVSVLADEEEELDESLDEFEVEGFGDLLLMKAPTGAQ